MLKLEDNSNKCINMERDEINLTKSLLENINNNITFVVIRPCNRAWNVARNNGNHHSANEACTSALQMN